MFWGFALARGHLKGDVGWPERSYGVLAPRASCVASRGVTAFWWLALVRRVSIRICDFTGCNFVSTLIFCLTRTSPGDVEQWSSLRLHVPASRNEWTQKGDDLCVMSRCFGGPIC